jgi:glycosyltransferase involved in cell wall biosynthesis
VAWFVALSSSVRTWPPQRRRRHPRRRGTLRSGLLAAVVLAVIAALIGFPDTGSTADADSVVTDTVDARHDLHRVSVVIPTHNRAAQLETALLSVIDSPLISSPDQIIVVDDDSQDRTPEVVSKFGVRSVTVARHSPACSRNAGWRRTATEYVTFLDDDDVWLPGNLEPQLAALDAHPRAGFAYGIARCAQEDLEPSDTIFPAPPLASGHTPGGLHEQYPQLGVVLFRRAALEEAAGFDPRVPYGEDAELMLRIAARREIVGVERVGMLHRIRRASRARSDYFWPLREIARWRPKGVGVGWHAALRFQVSTRGLFFSRFVDDAAACSAAGHRWDALVCGARATWVSPLHAVRHHQYLRSACLPGANWPGVRARLAGIRLLRTGADPGM